MVRDIDGKPIKCLLTELGVLGHGSMSSQDTELNKRPHSDLDDENTVNYKQPAYSKPAGQQNTLYAPDKQGIGNQNSNFSTDYRFAKANNSADGYNRDELINRLKNKGVDISNNQEAQDSIEFALRFQRAQGVRFDADQSLEQVADNMAKNPLHYSSLDDMLVNEGEEDGVIDLDNPDEWEPGKTTVSKKIEKIRKLLQALDDKNNKDKPKTDVNEGDDLDDRYTNATVEEAQNPSFQAATDSKTAMRSAQMGMNPSEMERELASTRAEINNQKWKHLNSEPVEEKVEVYKSLEDCVDTMDEMWGAGGKTTGSSHGWPVNKFFTGKITRKGGSQSSPGENVVETAHDDSEEPSTRNMDALRRWKELKRKKYIPIEIGPGSDDLTDEPEPVNIRHINNVKEGYSRVDLIEALDKLVNEVEQRLFTEAMTGLSPLNVSTFQRKRHEIIAELRNKDSQYYKRLQGILREGSIMGSPDAPANKSKMRGKRWTTLFCEADWEEIKKKAAGMGDEERKEYFRKILADPTSTFGTAHAEIMRKHELPTGRPKTPWNWDKPEEPIDEGEEREKARISTRQYEEFMSSIAHLPKEEREARILQYVSNPKNPIGSGQGMEFDKPVNEDEGDDETAVTWGDNPPTAEELEKSKGNTNPLYRWKIKVDKKKQDKKDKGEVDEVLEPYSDKDNPHDIATPGKSFNIGPGEHRFIPQGKDIVGKPPIIIPLTPAIKATDKYGQNEEKENLVRKTAKYNPNKVRDLSGVKDKIKVNVLKKDKDWNWVPVDEPLDLHHIDEINDQPNQIASDFDRIDEMVKNL